MADHGRGRLRRVPGGDRARGPPRLRRLRALPDPRARAHLRRRRARAGRPRRRRRPAHARRARRRARAGARRGAGARRRADRRASVQPPRRGRQARLAARPPAGRPRADSLAPLVDRYELVNRRDVFPWVAEAGLPAVASGDFHRLEHLATWKTLLPCVAHRAVGRRATCARTGPPTSSTLRSLLASRLPPSFRPSLATEAGSFSVLVPTPRSAASPARLVLASFASRSCSRGSRSPSRSTASRSLDPLPLAARRAGARRRARGLGRRVALRAPLRRRGGSAGATPGAATGSGSLANAVLPARLGDAVRDRTVRLVPRPPQPPPAERRGVPHRRHCARRSSTCCLCAGAAAVGLLPGWTLAAPPVARLAVLLVGVVRLRRGPERRGPRGSRCWPRSRPAPAPLCSAGRRVAAAARIAAAVADPRRRSTSTTRCAAALVGLAALGGRPAPSRSRRAARASPEPGWRWRSTTPGSRPRPPSPPRSPSTRVETVASLAFGVSGWIALRTTGAAADYFGTGSNL